MSDIVKCDACEDDFDYSEEGDCVANAAGDEYYCDDCCRHEYIWRCPICDDYIHTDLRGGVGTLLAVVDRDDDLEQTDGIYEILHHSYWRSDYFSIDLINHAIRRIGDIPEDVLGQVETCYPVEHICAECSVGIKRRVILARKY